MIKTIIPFALIALSAASFVLAEVEDVSSREPESIFSREDAPSLQEREPFFGALIGLAARVGGRVAARAGSRAVKHHVNNRNNNRRRRDLEPEDELDFTARDDDDDELVEREVDMIERELSDEDILEREVDEDLYLD